ncbi:MAG: hypothetical protein IT290_09395 [Deltaproteobacteria bacterium]|nr:hypothetical protein [Deltaproteobacteria bacterium]
MENDGGVNAYALLATGGPLPTVMIASAFALLPIGVLMVTSFVKISIVLNVIRSAIAAPGVPSAAMTGLLSLVLTGQVMAPIAREMWERAEVVLSGSGEFLVGKEGARSQATQREGVQAERVVSPLAGMVSSPAAVSSPTAVSSDMRAVGILLGGASTSRSVADSSPKASSSINGASPATASAAARSASASSRKAKSGGRSARPPGTEVSKTGLKRARRGSGEELSTNPADRSAKLALSASESMWIARLCAVPFVISPLEGFLRRHARMREREFFARRPSGGGSSSDGGSSVAPGGCEYGEPLEPNVRSRHHYMAAEPPAIVGENLITLIPAFLVSELASAFRVGFILALPFLVIDLVIVNILVTLGMSMVNPTQVSLPIKLAVFLLADGWFLLSESLVLSYGRSS